MSFDDRLRGELRGATEPHALDEERALREVKSAATPRDETIVVALEDVDRSSRRRIHTRRIVGIAAAFAVLAGGIALPLALRDRPNERARRTTPHKKPAPDRVAFRAVASALDATTNSDSFRVVFSFTESPGTAPTTSTTTCVSDSRLAGGQSPAGPTAGTSLNELCGYGNTIHNVTTTGVATVNVNPLAMVVVSNVSNFGDVTVRVDDTGYWETTGEPGDGLVPNAGLGASSPISSFAGLVEGTLGRREGAGAMMMLASPTGYLSIAREAITGAKELGTGAINGAAVKNYRVTLDPALLATVPGLSPEQLKTINAAVAVLHAEGFSGNTTDVSVDGRGFVVHSSSTNTFADGGTVVTEAGYSAFGCAGVVQLPGRPATPDAGCEVSSGGSR